MVANKFAVLYATQHRLDTRAMQTLLGICTGIAVDDHINDKEIVFLKTWLNENSSVAEYWPGSSIAARIDTILADGIITQEEKEDLLSLLRDITGNNFSETGAAAPDAPAPPIDDDPSIYFRNMLFCFTGRFFYGTRPACERVILNMGGMAVDNVSKKLNYLVIGALIEPSWAHTTYGRKIESAMKHKEAGSEISIVSEQQWTQAVADCARRN
ncbi:MAG: hypothetical protein A3J49_15205 [Gallionellales bacterium RIFCSPHIGHO2_02_FULL_57_16]|nr:MAG: hypothetical protein A3J49_15205 [Gallionellales bacterium RIFCSPHIGHO2_02_FULL_57_16]